MALENESGPVRFERRCGCDRYWASDPVEAVSAADARRFADKKAREESRNTHIRVGNGLPDANINTETTQAVVGSQGVIYFEPGQPQDRDLTY